MKILTKNKIVESYHFPFAEALIFSILIWTSWGLAEGFYWHRVSAMVDSSAATPDPFIYLEAFFIYVAIAGFLATMTYIGMRLALAAFHLHNTITFRACTLCGILAFFFASTIYFSANQFIWKSSLGSNARLLLTASLAGFAVLITILLYRYASGVDFRIRRSGTMMLSILIISVLLSLIDFPLFSKHESIHPEDAGITGYQKLMAHYYFQPLLKRSN